MTGKDRPRQGKNRPLVYQIRLKGHVSQQWADWFEGLTLTLEVDGSTLLIGPVVDQAALHGLLKKVRDLGVTLLSVNATDAGAPTLGKPAGGGSGQAEARPADKQETGEA